MCFACAGISEAPASSSSPSVSGARDARLSICIALAGVLLTRTKLRVVPPAGRFLGCQASRRPNHQRYTLGASSCLAVLSGSRKPRACVGAIGAPPRRTERLTKDLRRCGSSRAGFKTAAALPTAAPRPTHRCRARYTKKKAD